MRKKGRFNRPLSRVVCLQIFARGLPKGDLNLFDMPLSDILQLNRLLGRLGYSGEDPGTAFPGIKALEETPPPALQEAVQQGNCVLFGGENLSQTCGMPVWKAFLLGLCDHLGDTRRITREEADKLRAMHREGQYDRMERIMRVVTEEEPDTAPAFAARLYTRRTALSLNHEAIRAVPFCGALTPNLDALLESVMQPPAESVLTPGGAAAGEAALESGQKFILKLRGDATRADSVRLWPADARDAAREHCGALLREVLEKRTVLAAGVSLAELAFWLEATGSCSAARRHYAIVSTAAPGDTERAKKLWSRFNFEVFRNDTGGAVALSKFLLALRPVPA